MATQVLFIRGAGEGAYDHWDDELVRSLERELGGLNDGAVLVGHSVGAAVLLHALAERHERINVRGIFLVAAPCIGEGGWQSDDMGPCTELSERLPVGVPTFLYHGNDDEIVPVSHVQLYAKAIPQAVVRTCEGCNHQLNNDTSRVAHDIRSLP